MTLHAYSLDMGGIWGFPSLKVQLKESDDLTDSRSTVLKISGPLVLTRI